MNDLSTASGAIRPLEQREFRIGRTFVGSFCATLAAALVALTIVRMAPLPDAAITDPQLRWTLAAMPGDEIMTLKHRHAAASPRYDIGLFGNSRIMMIGADELRLPGKRIFNFAIGGSSIRQSIRLLEQLQASGRAPATAVISMDNVELGLPSISGGLPGLPHRWWTALNDAHIAWGHGGARGAAVDTINFIASEGRAFAIGFNHTFVLAKLRALRHADGPRTGFRSDGSLQETAPQSPSIDPMPKRADTYPQIEADFARLARIREAGTRIIVYESPIAPALGTSADEELSPNARQVRQRFRSACDRFALACFGPPQLGDRPWFNRDHAPAQSLADWLRDRIQ